MLIDLERKMFIFDEYIFWKGCFGGKYYSLYFFMLNMNIDKNNVVKKIFIYNINWWFFLFYFFWVIVICVFGELEIFCGKIVCFEVEIILEDDVFLLVSWDRVDGMFSK